LRVGVEVEVRVRVRVRVTPLVLERAISISPRSALDLPTISPRSALGLERRGALLP
jgi:hypothetical protein